MQMTSEEICRHYVQAADRKKDITILAELNETDEASIRAVLIDGGVPPAGPAQGGAEAQGGQAGGAAADSFTQGAKAERDRVPQCGGGFRNARRCGRESDHLRTGRQDPGGPAGSGKPENQNKGLQPRYEYAGGRHR